MGFVAESKLSSKVSQSYVIGNKLASRYDLQLAVGVLPPWVCRDVNFEGTYVS